MHRPPRFLHQTFERKRKKAMQKPATTDHPVHDFIVKRWSPRAFSDKPVPPEELRSLFEAARWAASSYNDQPWAYLVATKDDKENLPKQLRKTELAPRTRKPLSEFVMSGRWGHTAPFVSN